MYVVGHRGAAGVLPENTIKGFEYAIGLGVTYVECDVHLTSDHHLVVMHDETVDRTTHASGKIREMTFEAIRSLDAGDGLQVPTLEEVLAVTKGKVHLLCELKGGDTEEMAVGQVKDAGMDYEVTFTSFQLDRIQKVKKMDASLQIGAILPSPSVDDIQMAKDMGVVGFGVRYKNVCLWMVEAARKLGLEIRAWNPDMLSEQKAMIGLGVDGVSTNRPDILMAYLNEGA